MNDKYDLATDKSAEAVEIKTDIVREARIIFGDEFAHRLRLKLGLPPRRTRPDRAERDQS